MPTTDEFVEPTLAGLPDVLVSTRGDELLRIGASAAESPVPLYRLIVAGFGAIRVS